MNDEQKPTQEQPTAGSECRAGLGRAALEIMEALARMCEEGKSLTIAPDWGYGSGTLVDSANGTHTHFGLDIGDDEDEQLASFVRGLHDQLVKGRGLTWA